MAIHLTSCASDRLFVLLDLDLYNLGITLVFLQHKRLLILCHSLQFVVEEDNIYYSNFIIIVYYTGRFSCH